MARGFGSTRGSGTTDRIVTALTTNNSVRSYAIWANRNGTGGGGLGRMFDKNNGTAEAALYYSGGSNYSFTRWWSTSPGEWAFTAPSTGAFRHIGVSYDQSSTANDPVIYVSGSAVSTTEAQTPVGTVVSGSAAHTLGNRQSDNARNWDGDLAEFAAWDAILTAEEFASLAAGMSPLLVRPASLVCYVPAIRDNVDLKLTAPTITGTAVQPHPAVYMPAFWASTNKSAATGNAVWSSAGTGAASWTGASNNSQPWTAAGTGVAAWTGGPLNSQPWTAAGIGDAAWVGSSVSSGGADWAAAGVGAAAWTGAATADSVWASAALGDANWAGAGGAVTATTPAAGGGGARRRRQEYHYVVVDGVDYRVSSPEQAKEILLKLRELAAKRVQRQARKAVAKAPEAPVIQPIRATVKIEDYGTVFAQQLQAQVDAANAQIAEQYAQAVASAQAWQKHQRSLDDEDEEIETLILLGML